MSVIRDVECKLHSKSNTSKRSGLRLAKCVIEDRSTSKSDMLEMFEHIWSLITNELQISTELDRSNIIVNEALVVQRDILQKVLYTIGDSTFAVKCTQRYLIVLNSIRLFDSKCPQIAVMCILDILSDHHACASLENYYISILTSACTMFNSFGVIKGKHYLDVIISTLESMMMYSSLSGYYNIILDFFNKHLCEKPEKNFILVFDKITNHMLETGFDSQFDKCLNIRSKLCFLILNEKNFTEFMSFFKTHMKLYQKGLCDGDWREPLKQICIREIKFEIRRIKLVRKLSAFDLILSLFELISLITDEAIDYILKELAEPSFEILITLQMYLIRPIEFSERYILENQNEISDLQNSWPAHLINQCLLKCLPMQVNNPVLVSLLERSLNNCKDIPNEIATFIKCFNAYKSDPSSEFIFKLISKKYSLAGALMAVALISISLDWYNDDLNIRLLLGWVPELTKSVTLFRCRCTNNTMYEYVQEKLADSSDIQFLWALILVLDSIVREFQLDFLREFVMKCWQEVDQLLSNTVLQYFKDCKWDDIISVCDELLEAVYISQRIHKNNNVYCTNLTRAVCWAIESYHMSERWKGDKVIYFCDFLNRQLKLNAPTVAIIHILNILLYSDLTDIMAIVVKLSSSPIKQFEDLFLILKFTEKRNIQIKGRDIIMRASECRHDKLLCSVLLEFAANKSDLKTRPFAKDILVALNGFWLMAFVEKRSPLAFQIAVAKCCLLVISEQFTLNKEITNIQDIIINDVVLSKSPKLRQCINPMDVIGISSQLLKDKHISRCSKDLLFEQDMLSVFIKIGMFTWPKFVADSIIMVIRCLPNCLSQVESALCELSNFSCLSQDQKNRIVEKWDTQWGNLSQYSIQPKQQPCNNFEKLVDALIHHFYNPDTLNKVHTLSLDCKVTKSVILYKMYNIVEEIDEYRPFVSELLNYLSTKKLRCESAHPKDLFAEFNLSLSNQTIYIKKEAGWYTESKWIWNMQGIMRATLLSSNIIMWLGFRKSVQLMSLEKIDKCFPVYESSDVSFFQIIQRLVLVTCGIESIWYEALIINPGVVYFIAPLILRNDLKFACELLEKMNGWLATETAIFIICNNKINFSSIISKQALLSYMPKSALMICSESSTRLIFDIYTNILAYDDARAIAKLLNPNVGYELIGHLRSQSMEKLSLWNNEEKKFGNARKSIQHLFMTESPKCCDFFGKLENCFSDKDTCKFAHQLFHGYIDKVIGNNCRQEFFKFNLIKDAIQIGAKFDPEELQIRSVALLRKFPNVEVNEFIDMQDSVLPESTHLFYNILNFYNNGERELAFSYLQQLLDQVSSTTDGVNINVVFLTTYIEWVDHGKYESVQNTINRLSSVINVYKKSDVKSVGLVYNLLAGFLYRQYLTARDFIESKEFEQKQDISQCEVKKREKNTTKCQIMLSEYAKLDAIDVKQTKAEYDKLKLLTINTFIEALNNWNEENPQELRVLQLVNVLFHDEDLCRCVDQLPSGVFLPVIRQLSAKISNKTTNLNRLITRMLSDYPFNLIPVLLCLQSDNESDRHLTIDEILIVGNDRLHKRIAQYRSIFRVYQNIAEMNLINTIPSKVLSAISSLELVSVLTIEIKNKTFQHVYPIKLLSEITRVPGVTAPKIVKCLCSDGQVVRQVVKNRDDLRQDALIQQTFNVINNIFVHASKSQGFYLRRYMVCPITKKSGLLEYCEGTVSLGKYLADKKTGAHARYNPKDMSCEACRTLIQNAAFSSNQHRLKIYQDICSKFKPVFRNFFFERFKEPWNWFNFIQRFTRSVACSSIAGYILGLGDRHVNNILLDESTGEIIHIDFGIAFEQGRILPIPEIVPFRLTRDIVDGFGPGGPYGLFRAVAIECLTLLVQNKSVMDALVCVLVDDPLCNWTLNTKRMTICQPPKDFYDDENIHSDDKPSIKKRNKLAERTLMRIRQKLSVSLEEQGASNKVNQLIMQAIDPENLSRMYCGWQAYL